MNEWRKKGAENIKKKIDNNESIKIDREAFLIN